MTYRLRNDVEEAAAAAELARLEADIKELEEDVKASRAIVGEAEAVYAKFPNSNTHAMSVAKFDAKCRVTKTKNSLSIAEKRLESARNALQEYKSRPCQCGLCMRQTS